MNFPQKLKQLMDENKVTAYKVSNDIHCSQTSVQNWLLGRTAPQPRTILLLCEYFGVSEDELMCRPKKPQKNNPAAVSSDKVINDPDLYDLYSRLNEIDRQRMKDFARGLLASSEE